MNGKHKLAFPIDHQLTISGDSDWCGMTLRDYFAAAALQGMLSNPEFYKSVDADNGREIYYHSDNEESLAEMAYEQADAMMKARES